MLSFATRRCPLQSRAICSRAGAIILHGPHHSAHRSTRTGNDDCSTSAVKVASVTVNTSGTASGAWHLPQTGRSP